MGNVRYVCILPLWAAVIYQLLRLSCWLIKKTAALAWALVRFTAIWCLWKPVRYLIIYVIWPLLVLTWERAIVPGAKLFYRKILTPPGHWFARTMGFTIATTLQSPSTAAMMLPLAQSIVPLETLDTSAETEPTALCTKARCDTQANSYSSI